MRREGLLFVSRKAATFLIGRDWHIVNRIRRRIHRSSDGLMFACLWIVITELGNTQCGQCIIRYSFANICIFPSSRRGFQFVAMVVGKSITPPSLL